MAAANGADYTAEQLATGCPFDRAGGPSRDTLREEQAIAFALLRN
jgi:hypothetical protein